VEEAEKAEPAIIPIPIPIPETQATPETPSYSTHIKPKTQETPAIEKKVATPSHQKKAEIPLWLSILFAPLNHLIGYVKDVYGHFKVEERLPVFFLSLGGIIAMLFGIGYLMQLGITYFIEILSAQTLEAMKIGFALSTGVGILIIGGRLSKKEDKYRDFASALLGLGVAVCYLVFYFLPQSVHFPVFREPFLSLGLISLTAFLGSWLALKYETRIVAVVGFLGAALIPIFMEAYVLTGLYLGFLGLLSLSTLYIARRIDWKPLQMICLLLVIAVLEWMVFSSETDISAYTLIFALHGFAYMFLLNALWSPGGVLRTFNTAHVFMISSTLSLLIINSLGLAAANGLEQLTGWVFAANALGWALFCGITFKKLSASMRWLCFLISGAFVALAVFLLLDQSYFALGLGIEAILLLTFGFRFALPRVRIEAYALLSFVLFRCFYGMRSFVADWEMALWSDSFMHLLIVGGVLAGSLFLIRKFPTLLSSREKDLRYILSEGLFIWTIGTSLLIASKYLGIYTYNIALIPMIFMIYWGSKNKLGISERLGWVMSVCFVAGYLVSAFEVESYHFHEQSWAGKFAAIEGFAMLWFMQFLYKKWDADSELYTATKVLRNLFFVLLPIIYLPSVARRFPDFLPFAAWISVLFAFLLAKYRQRIELIIETHVLVLMASVCIFFELSVGGVAFGVLALGLIYVLEQANIPKSHKKSPFKHIHTYTFWYVALAVLLGMLKINNDMLLICPAALAIYFLALYYNRGKIAPLKRYPSLIYGSFMFAAILCCSILYFLFIEELWDFEDMLIPFMVSMWILSALALGFWHQLFEKIGQLKPYSFRLQIRFYFIQALIFLTYASTWSLIIGNSFGMGLTLSLFVHAITLLFFATHTARGWIQKFGFLLLAIAFAKLVLFDFRNFDLIYKVGVSILSGGLMLLAARIYLRGTIQDSRFTRHGTR